MADPISYMVAAYVVTVVALLVYGAALLRRLARATRKLEAVEAGDGRLHQALRATKASEPDTRPGVADGRPDARPGVAGAPLAGPEWSGEEVPHA